MIMMTLMTTTTRLVFVFRWTMDGIKRWDVRVSNAAYRSYAEGPEWWKLVVRGISFSVDGAMWYPIPLFVGLLRVGIMGFFPAFVTPTFFTDPPHVHTSVWALNADFWGHVALMATVGAIAELSLKVCFARDRPAVNSKTVYFPGESHSFPSGHTLRAAILAAYFAFHAPPGNMGWLESLPPLVFLAWAAAVAVSRVCLGRHFPTDVIVGYAIGFFIGYVLEPHLRND